MKKPDKEKCKHNGRKAYWNILSGFKCLKCGEECIEENGKVRLKTKKEIESEL